jgi:Na+-transporting methylmalonyl-CoA/oxaloacetate decarboxylase gamma subunit
MTRAGKILLYANLVLSLIMAAWGMALFYGRVNWTEKSPSDAPQGEYKKVAEKIAQLKPVVAAADARYREAMAQLENAQQRRAANLAWYQARSDELRFTATDQNPAVSPVLVGGLVQPGQPIQVEPAKDRAGEPLRSFKSYVADLGTKETEINAAMASLAQENQKYTELSDQIVGVFDQRATPPKLITPGFRQLLQDEQDKLGKVFDEIERLRPLLVNSYAEIQHLAKRHGLLQKQVDGLGSKGGKESASKVGTGVDK